MRVGEPNLSDDLGPEVQRVAGRLPLRYRKYGPVGGVRAFCNRMSARGHRILRYHDNHLDSPRMPSTFEATRRPRPWIPWRRNRRRSPTVGISSPSEWWSW